MKRRSRGELIRWISGVGSLASGVVISLVGGMAEGRMDLEGDGVSEIWRLKYAGIEPDGGDFDGDGVSNREEAIAGTDPRDADDSFRLLLPELLEEEVRFSWPGVAGKAYRLENWDQGSEGWQEVAAVLPLGVDGLRFLEVPRIDGAIYRLVVGDVDLDGDGLTAWEEAQLGWSDGDERSAGDPERGDFVAALRLMESAEGMSLVGGEDLPSWRPSEKQAARFLMKASFGPTMETIAEVQERGLTGWMDEQMVLPVLTTRTATLQNGLSINANNMRHGWWRAVNLAKDQLRHRVAYALSQIFVVNMQTGTVIGDNFFTQAIYYDIFVNGAFGPYREVLEKVTYSPVMGFYLSHLNNRKTDNPVNPTRFPDENFAREIMQLFTIGLWELNPDGSRKLDEDGNFIPTYDNDTITEMAKVFTGMSHSTQNNGQPATSFYNPARGNDYHNPMKVWEEEHEPGPKTIIGGVELDGTQTGEEEVQATLDALMAHESMGPFVSRLLIQRFTSSNPSPGYLARVTQAWNSGGGNLDRVMEAILLDAEVLDASWNAEVRGKVREPILRYLALGRAFSLARPDGKYAVNITLLNNDFGQFPTMAPSVFNFYLPDFAPEGEFRESGMVSPEMQLATMSQMLQSDSQMSATIETGHFSAVMDFTEELALAEDVEALIERVDLLLTGGRLREETRESIRVAAEAKTNLVHRVRTVVYLVSQSMECVVLR